MESKILIDVDYEMTPSLSIKQKNTDDIRDRLTAMFIQKATPEGITHDGFARISRLHTLEDGTVCAEIVPIHPKDMPKFIDDINRMAAVWKQWIADRTIQQPELES